ncbi:MAG: MaoC family dehydratase N-terminal domain-containing protein [Oleispira antarctica]|mgnify:FL=1|uniref:MaoC-like domain protein n=1 Tax=Oleispira antarctica RB-8 TaxID=698738 RepID=R4YN71_OLEAN|nr:MaoC family dehydratase N-terminal domain-containing protein [Oleispira antarctica]MBQ0793347.1 MaoC family dehydratase N-terminal domain-containing protein [Oleispira antarctica]CCK76265.1 MaoC-like domain protein [Oleispira antarctica RB-8]|tara:strand:- start:2455 stop:2928 length:474 start_codon:yes stop_codon:yes gene_type:complete
MTLISNRPFDTINIDDFCKRQHTVTEDDLLLFAKASGDLNPLHLDAEYAATTPFKQRIAHGMFTGGLISAALAMDLPGPGTIYLSQDLQFKRPVCIGDTLTVTLTAVEKHPEKPIVTLQCVVTNQDDKAVVIGTAKVMAPTVSMTVEACDINQLEES